MSNAAKSQVRGRTQPSALARSSPPETSMRAVEMKAHVQWVKEVKQGEKVEPVNSHITKEASTERHQEDQSFSEKCV